MSCRYCDIDIVDRNLPVDINHGRAFGDAYLSKWSDNSWTLTVVSGGSMGGFYIYELAVRYCPICGRELPE